MGRFLSVSRASTSTVEHMSETPRTKPLDDHIYQRLLWQRILVLGEEIKDEEGQEAGRGDAGTTGADRPAGWSEARDSTAINPDDVETVTDSPKMPPA